MYWPSLGPRLIATGIRMRPARVRPRGAAAAGTPSLGRLRGARRGLRQRAGEVWQRFLDDHDLVMAKLWLLAGLVILTAVLGWVV